MGEPQRQLPIAIDSNVLIYAITGNHPDFSQRSRDLLFRAATGDAVLHCAPTAIFETVYIVHKRYGFSRQATTETLSAIVELPAVLLEHREAVIDALRFWTEQPALDFADCYHLALTKNLGLDAIYTFDRKMDRYPGVTRLEP